jgi:foldase protein PrsA
MLATLGMASCGEQTTDAGRVVARVNGKDLTYGQLVERIEQTRGPSVLLDMIDQTLIQQEAQRRGLSLTENERQAGLDRAAARVGSMVDLKTRLRRSGIPLEAYQQKIEFDLLLDKIALQDAKVTDAEVTAFYREHRDEYRRGERVRARMMLFGDKGSAEAVAEALASPGADFAGLAKTLSEDSTTAGQGGDMGWIERDDYAKPITDAAFSLKPGATSGIIKAPDGWVILKVEARRAPGVVPLAEMKAQIRQRMQIERLEEVRMHWLTEARKAAKLDVRDPQLSSGVQAILDSVPPPPMPGEL